MIVADFHTLSSFRSPAIRRPAALDPASDDGDDAELWTFNDFVVHGHRRSDEPARPRKAETNSLQDPPSTLQNRHISCIVIFSHISIYIYIYIYIHGYIYLCLFVWDHLAPVGRHRPKLEPLHGAFVKHTVIA